MKKTLKRIAVLILALVMLLALTACAIPANVATDPSITVGGLTSAEIVSRAASSALDLFLLAISILISYIVIPFLKNTAIPWLKEKKLYSTILIFVKAAEKLGATGAIVKAKKKEYVLKQLKAKGIDITPEVEDMIEAAVTEVDNMANTIIGALVDDTSTKGGGGDGADETGQ